jgi:hypothetical protein
MDRRFGFIVLGFSVLYVCYRLFTQAKNVPAEQFAIGLLEDTGEDLLEYGALGY